MNEWNGNVNLEYCGICKYIDMQTFVRILRDSFFDGIEMMDFTGNCGRLRIPQC